MIDNLDFMKLFLIRHQKTLWNLEGKLQGRFDKNDIIRDKDFYFRIKKNKEILRSVKNLTVCSSPMLRAKNTAHEYGFYNFEIEEDLKEYDFGIWEGKLKQELMKDYSEEWLYRFPSFQGGESFETLQARITNVLNKYTLYENVVFFTHGVVCRYIVSIAYGYDINKMNQIVIKNNEMIELQF